MTAALKNCSFTGTILTKCCTIDLSCKNWYPVSSLLNLYGSNQVRYIKPRWLPRAPSKQFVITGRKRLPPRELAENLRLYKNQKYFLRLTRQFCEAENLKMGETSKFSIESQEQEEREFQELMNYNQKENERMAKLRAESLTMENEKLLEDIMAFKQLEEEKQVATKEKALKKLTDTKELVKTFVKLEDLDAAIEFALNNPVDYNFSLDLTGRIYKGRKTLPHLVDKEKLEVLPIVDEGATTDIILI